MKGFSPIERSQKESEVLEVADFIGEQEVLRLLSRLNQDHSPKERVDADTAEVKDGFIRVEQGKVIVVNPSNGGRAPTLRAAPPVKLSVNGQEVKSAVQVSSDHLIEWKIEHGPLYEISLSNDKMAAYLVVHRLKKNAWSLTDQSPSLHMVLTASEDPNLILDTVRLPDILATVEEMNIKMNLDFSAIHAEMTHPSHRNVRIAEGKPPVQGEDARLEIYFPENIESVFEEVGGVVDFKNHLNIPSVKKGDLMARKIPSVAGQAGYDVHGAVLLPDPVKDIRLAGKENVEITPDLRVVALREGRPRVTGSQIKYFDINQAFVVPGNVDLNTGNIVFAGDVVVYGDVMDNMIIESLGNIYVSGSVFNATLTATGSIAVQGNVLGSNLYSGYFGMLYNRLYHGAKRLTELLESMVMSADRLLQEIGKQNRQVRYGQVLLLLMESKYQQTDEIVKEMLSVISSIQAHNNENLQQLRSYMEIFLLPVRILDVMTAPRMEEFMRILKAAVMRVALSQESRVQISINQAHNSNLKSNGDILIRREGILQCDLYSAGNIIFYLDSAVCRGSRLEAGDTISAMQVGSITGVGTVLKATKKIMVKRMYGGRIILDRFSKEINEQIEERTFDYNSIHHLN